MDYQPVLAPDELHSSRGGALLGNSPWICTGTGERGVGRGGGRGGGGGNMVVVSGDDHHSAYVPGFLEVPTVGSQLDGKEREL